MKQIRLYGVLIIALLSLTSVLVFAQFEPPNQAVPPEALATPTLPARFEPPNQAVPPEALAYPTFPSDMETALVPCGDGVTGPCDMIATSVEDVVGVWAQYLLFPPGNTRGSIAYIRFNADGTFVVADSIENTAQPFEGMPSGTYQFEDAQLIFDPILSAPEPCNGAGIFQARVLKYGDVPIALRYVPISDACTFRLQDLSQAAVWVAE